MTLIFAHRGSSGTHPENTMASFIEAIKVGADGIELDVHLTKDNQIIVMHDHTINRTTNGNGRIKDYTYQELQQFEAGSWYRDEFRGERIPTLSEVLQLIQCTNLLVNIELKNDVVDYEDIETLVLQEIETFNLSNRAVISSFNHYSLNKIHAMNPQIECAILYMEKLFKPVDYSRSLGATGLHPQFKLVDDDLIKEANRKHIPIRAYTVNFEHDMEALMKGGCTAIITDFPKRAIAVRNLLAGGSNVDFNYHY